MIRFGFLIKDKKIYDTQILEYKLKKDICGVNIIFHLEPHYYKRLYFFEPLLFKYDVDTVFKILAFNKYLRKDREVSNSKKSSKIHYMTNYSTIYNYPPTYLTQRKFSIYKTCQKLKKRTV